MFIRLTALAMVLLANTCNQKAVKEEIGNIQSKRWSLTSLNGAPQEKSPIWLEFDTAARRFSGNAGCNKVSGQYDRDGGQITFGKVISTRMACIDQAANERETAFLKLLSDRTYNIKFENQQLQFRDSGRVAMSFAGFKKAAR